MNTYRLGVVASRFFKVISLVTLSQSVFGSSLSLAANPANREEFFDSYKMYYVRVLGWSDALLGKMELDEAKSVPGARVEVYYLDDPAAHKGVHCPDAQVNGKQPLLSSANFEIGLSGNRTRYSEKSSYKVKLKKPASGGNADSILGMDTLNLKSMWNDVSQMREALAWKIMKGMQLAAPGHTYAKVCFETPTKVIYRGLYSIIENIDEGFLASRFPSAPNGNLYKGDYSKADVGAADLGPTHDHIYLKNKAEPTYELKTNKKLFADPKFVPTDLAQVIETVNSTQFAPESDQFRAQVEPIFNVYAFLKWAAVNVLLGSWDDYYTTASNFFIYDQSPDKPYFTFIPWDYDNSFGVSYTTSPTKDWYAADLLTWNIPGTNIHAQPFVRQLLRNPRYVSYYLDNIEYLLKNYVNNDWIDSRLQKLWSNISDAAYLEADGPKSVPHTHRQFNNEMVYWFGPFIPNRAQALDADVARGARPRPEADFLKGDYLSHINPWDKSENRSFSISGFVRRRHDLAMQQLPALRARFPHLNQ